MTPSSSSFASEDQRAKTPSYNKTKVVQHVKHTLGIRDQKGWNRCPEWGPGTKVGVPEKGKIKKNSKAF